MGFPFTFFIERTLSSSVQGKDSQKHSEKTSTGDHGGCLNDIKTLVLY